MSKCCYDQLREKCCLELVPKWFRPVTLFTSRKPLRQYKTRPKIDSHLSGYGQSRIIFAGESGEEEKRQIPSCQSALKPPVCSISEDIITLQPSDCFHQEAPGCLCETHTDRHILYRIPTHTHTHTHTHTCILSAWPSGHFGNTPYSPACHRMGCRQLFKRDRWVDCRLLVRWEKSFRGGRSAVAASHSDKLM